MQNSMIIQSAAPKEVMTYTQIKPIPGYMMCTYHCIYCHIVLKHGIFSIQNVTKISKHITNNVVDRLWAALLRNSSLILGRGKRFFSFLQNVHSSLRHTQLSLKWVLETLIWVKVVSSWNYTCTSI